MTIRTITEQFSVGYSYPVIFTRDLFDRENPTLATVVRAGGHPRNRALIVIDSEVARHAPDLLARIGRFADEASPLLEVVAPPFLVRGGEICKNNPLEVAEIQALVERHRLCRHSFIIAVGGGAVLDAVGYAAATAHRGIRLIRVPTTVLGQNDAGIGVKNGINAFGRKNFLGCFAPPFAVINDFSFLATLPTKALRSGIAEAVKVALIRDRSFFERLEAERLPLARFEPEAMERMIIRCAELHLEHIGTSGDPFENGSSRPLDFGHWVAHKLEDLTGGGIGHGEAVAIGVAVDSLYSNLRGLLGERDLRRILDLLEGLGFVLHHPDLISVDVESALAEFREHLGGELSIPLLRGIGTKVEAHEIDIPLMRRCIDTLAKRVGPGGADSSMHPDHQADDRGRPSP